MKMADINMDAQPEGNQVVHIRSDSDTELQLLFDRALKPKEGQRQLCVPMSMRNLPKSFWSPPSTGSKTPSLTSVKESNCDLVNPHSPSSNSPTPPAINTVHHARAHSSPASFGSQAPLVAAANNQNDSTAPTVPQHVKQTSLINVAEYGRIPYDPNDGGGPLPLGWEKAKTAQGQVYFLK